MPVGRGPAEWGVGSDPDLGQRQLQRHDGAPAWPGPDLAAAAQVERAISHAAQPEVSSLAGLVRIDGTHSPAVVPYFEAEGAVAEVQVNLDPAGSGVTHHVHD